MDLVVFDKTELVAAARALRTVAEVNSVFAGEEIDLIEAIAALHDVVLDPRALAPITPEELARTIMDPHKRKRALQLLIVMSLVEGEANRASDAPLASFAKALDVDERALDVVREVAADHLLLARFDMVRRLSSSLFRGEVLSTVKSLATSTLFGEDRAVAEKYRALATYPEGTLGRVLYDSWQEHGFGVPGERGSMVERGVFHDVGHILSGYGVDPAGEIRQAAFQAGFIRNDGFAFLLFAILQFHLGVRITPIAKGERGHFDAKAVLRAAKRGAACKVDLSDPSQWDFWKDAMTPVAELRARYGITD